MEDLPIKIEFKPAAIVEAILLLSDIHVNKATINRLSPEDLDLIAYDVIYETCSAIMHTLKDDNNKAAVLAQLIRQSNLKFLERDAIIPFEH